MGYGETGPPSLCGLWRGEQRAVGCGLSRPETCSARFGGVLNRAQHAPGEVDFAPGAAGGLLQYAISLQLLQHFGSGRLAPF